MPTVDADIVLDLHDRDKMNTIITIIVDVINAMDMAALTKSWTAQP